MHRFKTSLNYLLAVLISLATLGLVWTLPIEDRQVSLVLLMAAVVVSAWLFGWRAGLLATAVCATASVLMHLIWGQDLMHESIRITAFLSLSLFILTLSILRQEAEDSLTRSETQLRAILDHSRDPISVNHKGTHQFVNPAYLRMFGHKSSKELIGKSLLDAIAPDDRQAVGRLLENGCPGGGDSDPFEIHGVRGDGRLVDLKVYVSSYSQNGEELVMVILRDITERKNALREKEHLISELREALSKVKKLHGLLPTCASCKKIRDEEGIWHDMETYITEHSEADFSHGFCPRCAEQLYPEVFGRDSVERISHIP